MPVEDDPAVVLDRFIRKKVELSYTHPLLSKLFAMEVIQGAPHLKPYLKTDMRTWVRNKAAVIEQWVRNGQMKPLDPVYLIFLIWSATQHYADFDVQVRAVLGQEKAGEERFEDAARFLEQLFTRGLAIPK